MSNQKQEMGGSGKQTNSTEDDEFGEAYDKINKLWDYRACDLADAYVKSGKDHVQWYLHFIRCLESIKKGPPAKDAVDPEDTGGSRSRKRQRADSRSSTPSYSDADAYGDSPEPAGTVGKVLTTSGPATYRVLEGPAMIRVKTKGSVTVKVTQAATVRVEEARKVQVETERGKLITTFETDEVPVGGGTLVYVERDEEVQITKHPVKEKITFA